MQVGKIIKVKKTSIKKSVLVFENNSQYIYICFFLRIKSININGELAKK